MKITVAGTGYVGLVTGVSLAEIGHFVTCFDIDEDKIVELKKGKSPIYEPGLDEMLQRNLNNKRLCFTSEPEFAYSNPEIILIAVGTPERDDGSADLSFVRMVIEDISHYFKRDELVVVTKSTVPVGTNKKIREWIEEKRRPIKLDIISNPEFLREGSAIHDTFNGDRIIIGSESTGAASILEEVYKSFKIPIVHTDIESAEMIKYASNAFLATKISFINEIANICEKVGANIEDVAVGIGLDNRIGPKFLQAGIGYGGSCFPKDTKALVQLAGNVEHKFELLESVIKVNNNQQIKLINKAKECFGSFVDKKVAILGVTFKPNTDDIRESASLIIIKRLLEEGAIVSVFDPIAYEKIKKYFDEDINCTNRIEDAIKDADLAFIITEWNEILNFPIIKYKQLMKTPFIFDGRNCYKLEDIISSGIHYYSIGRKRIDPSMVSY